MSNTFNNSLRKNYPIRISETLPDINKNITKKYGKLEFIIFSKWKEMTGDFFNEFSEPDRLNIIPDNRENIYQGILHINILSSAALEFQHFNNKIIDKINSFLGYKAITKIVLHQVSNLKKPIKSSLNEKSIESLDKNDESILKKTTSTIKGKDLESALLKLGESILKNKNQK